MERGRGARLLCLVFALALGANARVLSAEEQALAITPEPEVVSTPITSTYPGNYDYNFADEEPQRIVVTATRIPTPVDQVANSVTVFESGTPGGGTADGSGARVYTAGNFEDRQYRTVDEVLKNTPGVTVRQNGGTGTLTSVFMRGMESGRTLVLLDGMPLNDPSSVGGTFDFGGMTLDNISQLEVLRGPNSTLYGSSASAGVINLTSKKGKGPFSGYFSTEAGSRGTVMSRFGSSAGSDKFDYSFAGSLTHTDGFSNIDKKRYGFKEKDGYEQGTFSLRLGANPFENLRLDLFANVQEAEVELDKDNGLLGDDPDYKQRLSRYMIRQQAALSLFEGRWEQTIGFGYVQTKRKYKDQDGAINGTWPMTSRDKFTGETFKLLGIHLTPPTTTRSVLVYDR